MDNKSKTNDRIKCCSVNIDRMSDTSQVLLDKYTDEEQIDFLFVQETGSTNKEKLKLSNMKLVTDPNKAVNRGAALYARNHFAITDLNEISYVSPNIDSAWALIVVQNTRYIVGSVYAKLHYDQAMNDVTKMLYKAEQLSEKHRAAGVIIAGDFNARHKAWGDTVQNKYGNLLYDKLDPMKFTIHYPDTPTYRFGKGHSTIDLYITSTRISDKVEHCRTDEEVHLNNGAPLKGHLPVFCNLKVPQKKNATSEEIKEKIDIESINWQEWASDIEDAILNKQQSTEIDNPLIIWAFMEGLIDHATKSHAKLKRSSQHSKPYWTQQLTKLLNKMRAARKRYNKRNTDPNKEDWLNAKAEFDLERKTACETFILKKTQMLNTAEAVEFWKKFNKLFKTRSEKGVDPLKDEKGCIISENSKIEETLFGTFFESKHLISTNFDNLFYNEVNRIYDEIKSRNFESQLFGSTISELQDILNSNISITEIKAAIKKTKTNNKSMDNHNMHPKMLQYLGPNALKLLQHLFNSCLEQGTWIWNEAEVIFLKKEGKDSYAVPGSYRPISITSYVGKIFEKILAARINSFLINQGILDPDQEGFTAKRSTNRYLNRLIHEIKNDLKEHTVISLFIDLEKAFDSIWKKGLIVKLSKLNFQGKVLRLIDDFLSSRKVKLNINGEIGPNRDCKEYGLPQGSALSPVLFKIYLLDIFENLSCSDNISCFKFADDGSIKIRNKSSKNCAETLQIVANDMNAWTRKWRLNINCQPNKTEYICFGTPDGNAQDIPAAVQLGNSEIKKVAQSKVLGVTIDENLDFIPHSNNVFRKIQGKWARICTYTNKHWGFNQRVITQITQTFFLTSLHYAGINWINEKNLKEIEQLWYKIVKSAVGATFNIRKSLAEIIIGLPPISLQNELNKIKYYLKLNIKPEKEDRVREFIKNCYKKSIPTEVFSELRTIMKTIFKFSQWKLENYTSDFTDQDKTITQQKLFEDYFKLSTKACSYTKSMITKYTEVIWGQRVKNEFTAEGYHHSPIPTCTKLPIPENVTRENEVLLMSMFYPNNLLNNNVYQLTYQIESPLCNKCKETEETAYHILLECSNLSGEAYQILESESNGNIVYQDSISLLNASRNKKFLKICLEILGQREHRHQIVL